MNEKIIHGLIIGGIVLLVVIAFLQIGEKQTISSSDNTHKISVTGSAEKDVLPDEVVLSLTVLSEGSDAKQVQEKNSQQMNTAIEALKNAGIKDNEIETTQYSLYPWQEWDQTTQKNLNKGYRLQQTISVTTTETAKAGELLDLAVKNGINTVDSMSFRLSNSKEQQVKEALVAEASAKAKEKAKMLAKSLDVSLGDVLFVTESSYNPGPWYYNGAMKTTAIETAAAPTISPQQVKVSLQVNVDFEIE